MLEAYVPQEPLSILLYHHQLPLARMHMQLEPYVGASCNVGKVVSQPVDPSLFGVIFPVISQTITPLGCDALQSSAEFNIITSQ